jgi:GNAT superfamily N-acetyltransferase
MNIYLRAGSPDDAEACGTICYDAFHAISGQHNFPSDFPVPDIAVGLLAHVFSRADVYSVVAEVDGRVVGSNFLWEYAAIAGVGPITVAPDQQNSSIGRRLMEDVLERARERRFAGVRLVQAAYHNRSLSLYTKLGFDAREPLAHLQGAPLASTIPGHAVRVANENDLEACNALCCRVHGFERGVELFDAINQGTATVVEQGGRITGYATMIGYFGHAVAEGDEALKALIGAAPAFPGQGFLLPTRNSNVLRWCLAHGLRIVQPLTLMSVGLYSEPAGAWLPSILY